MRTIWILLSVLMISCGSDTRPLPNTRQPDAMVTDGGMASSDGGTTDGGPFATCSQPCDDPIFSACRMCNGVAQCVSPQPHCSISVTGADRNGAFAADGCSPGECNFTVESRDTGLFFSFDGWAGDKNAATTFAFWIQDFSRIRSGVEFEVSGPPTSYVSAGGCGPQMDTKATITWTSSQALPLPVEGSRVVLEMSSPLCHPDNDMGILTARAEAVFFLPE